MIFLSGYGLKSWSSHEMDPHINNKPAGFLAKNPSLFSHFVVTSFRLSQFQPYFISRHHHCDLCFCWPWHWSKDYMKNTKKNAKGKTQNMQQQQICLDSAQMAGKIIPVEGQRCFFSKTPSPWCTSSPTRIWPVVQYIAYPFFWSSLANPKNIRNPHGVANEELNKKQLTFRAVCVMRRNSTVIETQFLRRTGWTTHPHQVDILHIPLRHFPP